METQDIPKKRPDVGGHRLVGSLKGGPRKDMGSRNHRVSERRDSS